MSVRPQAETAQVDGRDYRTVALWFHLLDEESHSSEFAPAGLTSSQLGVPFMGLQEGPPEPISALYIQKRPTPLHQHPPPPPLLHVLAKWQYPGTSAPSLSYPVPARGS
jgi:hypothetical protein